MLHSIQVSKRDRITDRVQSYVRIRPSSNFAHDNIEIIKNKTENVVQIHANSDNKYPNIPQSANHLQKSWRFNVDDVLYNADQSEVYSTVAERLVSRALDGYSGTLVAYGESGSGKTFTLSGARDNSDFGQRGLSPRAIGHIFQHIKSEQCKSDEFKIAISYLEINGNKLTDLLVDQQPKKKLEIFEDDANVGATKVDGLSKNSVQDENEAFNMFLKGDSRRSRHAHSIFTIYINSKSHTISGGMMRAAELKFVDLTSWGRTEQNRITAASAPSLTFLEQVVISLQTKCKDCIPWRSCPLTHVLKGSFKRGNTILLTTIFGDKCHLQGSLTTLRFAARVNNLPVDPAHIEVSDAESRVHFLENELQKLKDELKMRYILNRQDDRAPTCSNYEPLTISDIESARKQVRDYLGFKSNSLDVLSLRHVNKLFELMREEYLSRDRMIEEKLRQIYHFVDKDSTSAHDVSTPSGKQTGAGMNQSANKAPANVKEDKKASKDKKSDKKGKKGNAAHSDSKTSVGGSDSNKLLPNSSSTAVVDGELIERKSMDTVNSGDLEVFNITEAFEEFKKNTGRGSYMHILSCKKNLAKNHQAVSAVAGKINLLVDEIDNCEQEVKAFSSQHPETDIITEDECNARQTLASKKNQYILLREEFNKLQVEEMEIHKELETYRKSLIIEFSEEHPNNDIFGLANLELLSSSRKNEQTQPPFTISQQKEQTDPSFSAWQGARSELLRSQQRTVIHQHSSVFK